MGKPNNFIKVMQNRDKSEILIYRIASLNLASKIKSISGDIKNHNNIKAGNSINRIDLIIFFHSQ